MPIALLTDFGTRDPYVAAMKGVISQRTATAIHDLTHDIEPYDVPSAAWFLATVAPYWTPGTVFVAVVDPGVGTSRQIVLAEVDGQQFLAPDNGLLTFVLSRAREWRAWAVTSEALFLPDGSNTFHGRDRFAPVAAALAEGLRSSEVGPRVEQLVRLPYEPPDYGPPFVKGTIVAIDRFGNAITDIERASIPFEPFALRTGGMLVGRLEHNYGDAAPEPFLIVGSTGCIEISISRASAAARLNLRRLDRVEIVPQPV